MLVVLILCIFLGASGVNCATAQTLENPSMYFALAEWAFEVRGEDDYDPNPSGEFPRGERGYAYVEVAGFAIDKRERFYVLELDVDVALETKNGLRLFSQADVLELEEWYVDPPESTWFYIYVDIPWWAPRGTYRTLITVRDEISGLALNEIREIMVK